MSEDAKTKVYFDGSCPLCRAEIFIYQGKAVQDVEFVDVSDPEFRGTADLDPKQAMKRFHVRTENGNLLDGAYAFGELWRKTPGFTWLGRVMKIPGVGWLADRIYNAFLTVRPLVQRVFCFVSNRSEARRNER